MTTGRPGIFKNPSAKLASIPMVLTVLVVFIGCSLWTVSYSFTNSRLLPNGDFVGLAQYERLWSTSRWLVSIENLMIFGGLYMTLAIVLGFILAALLDQKIRFEDAFRTVLLYPFALSFIVTGATWQWMLNPDFGLQKIVRDLGFESFTFNPLFNPEIAIYGVLLAALWHGTGLIMVLMLAGLRSVDEDIWKATRVDGVPAWRTYLFVVIPIMRPVFVTAIVLLATQILKVYDLVVAQTAGGPGIATEVPAKYVYDNMFNNQNIGQAFAASTMMLLMVMVILVPWIYTEYGRGGNRG
ncbi:MAG: carbohydrate ABC transporter permease [Sphingomonadaceae bacterium]